jgi:hypothetical protein
VSGSINFAVLFGSGAAIQGNSLLNTLYGFSKTSTANAGDPLVALTTAERNQTQDIATTAKQPDIQRDITAFKAAVAGARDAATLLKNPTVLKVLLTANGLGDQTSYPALAQKALLSNASSSTSLVNRLSDSRWKAVVTTYDFSNKGLSVLQNPAVQTTLANAYAEVSWRQSLDATTPGLSNALTFRAKASSITSVDQILGDPTLRTVITTALCIPREIAFQSLPAQERAISNRLDLQQLSKPHFVDSLTQEYLLAAQASSNGQVAASGLNSLLV